MNKLILILTTALVLGGCTLSSQLWSKSATDTALPTPTASPVALSPSPSPDPELESQPQTTTGTDYSSLESDLNSTVILEEDFSDLE